VTATTYERMKKIVVEQLGVDEEDVTLLTWAIAQPQKRVSTGVIELLLERGGKSCLFSMASQTSADGVCSQGQRRVKLVANNPTDASRANKAARPGQIFAT